MKNDKKSFKFYRSYYDVAMLLKPKHRLQFLMAILESHFDDRIMTTLSPTAHLAFIGQSHAINKQVLGYKSMINSDLSDLPYEGSYEGSCQEREREGERNKENNNKKEKDNDKGKEKHEGDQEHDIEKCMAVALRDKRWASKAKADKEELTAFNDHLILSGINKKGYMDYKRHFVNWKNKKPASLVEITKQNRDDSW